MSLGRVFTTAVLLALSVMVAGVSAREIEKVNFADQLDVAGKKLILNGAGLRVKRKLGMNFDVYVAGLYTVAKSDKSTELIASGEPKLLRLVFLRSLDKGTLREAWDEGYKKNCKADCSAGQDQLKAFNDLMVDVKDKSELNIQFDQDSVNVEAKGKESKSGKISGEPFRRALLAVFIGDEPPTEDLKKGLLGK